MLGNNYTSVFINSIIFIGILFGTYYLSSLQKDNRYRQYGFGAMIILAFLTYLPYGIGYIVDLVLLYWMSKKDKSLIMPAVAFLISVALTSFISFIVTRAIIPISVSQAFFAFSLIIGIIIFLATKFMAKEGLLANIFVRRYSDFIHKLPNDYSISYKNAIQKPTITYPTEGYSDSVTIDFGNGRVVVNIKNQTVDVYDFKDLKVMVLHKSTIVFNNFS